MYKAAHNRGPSHMRNALIFMDALCFNSVFVGAFLCAESWGWVAKEIIQTDFYTLWILFNLSGLISVLHLRLYARATIKQLRKVKRASWASVMTLLLVFTGCALLEHRFAGVYYLLVIMAVLVILYVMLSRYLLAYMFNMRHTRAASSLSGGESFR